jgi:formylglycine-generating enzyme required for sulfatase activity
MVLLAAGAAQATISIATVPVGNPGNAADTRYATPGYGSVAYSYNIGKYDVTAGQYTVFLNAVAATDTYGLYNSSMWSDTSYGCQIQRTGASGSYTYSVSPTYANRPVNYVSFWDACRFANWLNNGQQGASTTEYGTYTLTTSGMTNNTITRNTGATWAVTSEDEWYKAAYYDPNKAGGAGYWLYPTGSQNSITTAMANYNNSVGHPTDVGSYAYPSPYGTYDQGGNVYDLNEAISLFNNEPYRGVRGGAFFSVDYHLRASVLSSVNPTYDGYDVGFRVSEVPEPATMSLLALGGLLALRRRRGR